MTDQEIRIAIAEACGWKRCLGSDHSRSMWPAITDVTTEKNGVMFPQNGGFAIKPPDYPSDLNAMASAEIFIMERGKLNSYPETLRRVVADKPEFWQEISKDSSCATARQRAEAFLRTLGKWKDSA